MKVQGIPLPLSQSFRGKFCPRCSTDKLVTEFSRNRAKKDGFADWCKVCTKAFQTNPEQAEKSRVRRRRWTSDPANLTKFQEWRRLPESRRMARARAALERGRHPDKVWARNQATLAIRRGELIPKPCEVCQRTRVDAHHDDYSKPLDVRWLCRKHHNQHHATA